MNNKLENLWLFDENRLLILRELYVCDMSENLCGCDLTQVLNIKKNLLSYHIKVLRDNGIIEEVKCGRRKEYVICKDKIELVSQALSIVNLI